MANAGLLKGVKATCFPSQAANLKEKIAGLEKGLAALLGTSTTPPKARHTMSVAGRARVAAAQRARWAKVKAAKGKPAAKPARKKISAVGIARIRAAKQA